MRRSVFPLANPHYPPPYQPGQPWPPYQQGQPYQPYQQAQPGQPMPSQPVQPGEASQPVEQPQEPASLFISTCRWLEQQSEAMASDLIRMRAATGTNTWR
ncbi:MAG: hypothetical protein ACXVBU_06935, partial [Ktedonobacteraceae bacterium]